MRWLMTIAMLGLAPSGAIAQDDRSGLEQAAARARAAWLAHDVAGLVANSPRLTVQLPGTDPSAALSPAQAAALLVDFLAPTREVDLVVRTTREVEPGHGYVELLREYRVEGTQDVRSQTVFLGYRRGQQGWALVELRAIRR